MDGAHLVVDPDQAVADVLEIAQAHGHADVSSSPAAGSLRGELQIVYESLDGGATTDEIVDATGLDPQARRLGPRGARARRPRPMRARPVALDRTRRARLIDKHPLRVRRVA